MKIGFLMLLLVSLVSCSRTPTGRRQLNILSSRKMDSMGDSSFDKILKSKKISTNSTYNKRVVCITHRLLKVMNEKPSTWNIKVFNDPSPNAFALPGKNIGVHTGMIELVQNNDQLAAVIGHEIGHVLGNHGNERMSQAVLTQAGMTVAQLTLGADSEKDKLILGALGLGAQFGVLLPFSRKQESEADELGLKYMVEAGFRGSEAAQLWRVMAQKSQGSSPEFLSTHPSSQTRIRKLTKLSAKYPTKSKTANLCP